MERTKNEPTVTFLNTPPTGERILEVLCKLVLEQEGFKVMNVKVEPSPTGKTIINLNHVEEGIRHCVVVGEGVTCEKI